MTSDKDFLPTVRKVGGGDHQRCKTFFESSDRDLFQKAGKAISSQIACVSSHEIQQPFQYSGNRIRIPEVGFAQIEEDLFYEWVGHVCSCHGC